jgi:hypothetical protein
MDNAWLLILRGEEENYHRWICVWYENDMFWDSYMNPKADTIQSFPEGTSGYESLPEYDSSFKVIPNASPLPVGVCGGCESPALLGDYLCKKCRASNDEDSARLTP